uniref:Uncharacterized protein n=1 Tax=Ditylenchus dipsaci TaxID=166011 RepID=A0A915DXZ5_9BILA
MKGENDKLKVYSNGGWFEVYDDSDLQNQSNVPKNYRADTKAPHKVITFDEQEMKIAMRYCYAVKVFLRKPQNKDLPDQFKTKFTNNHYLVKNDFDALVQNNDWKTILDKSVGTLDQNLENYNDLYEEYDKSVADYKRVEKAKFMIKKEGTDEIVKHTAEVFFFFKETSKSSCTEHQKRTT